METSLIASFTLEWFIRIIFKKRHGWTSQNSEEFLTDMYYSKLFVIFLAAAQFPFSKAYLTVFVLHSGNTLTYSPTSCLMNSQLSPLPYLPRWLKLIGTLLMHRRQALQFCINWTIFIKHVAQFLRINFYSQIFGPRIIPLCGNCYGQQNTTCSSQQAKETCNYSFTEEGKKRGQVGHLVDHKQFHIVGQEDL